MAGLRRYFNIPLSSVPGAIRNGQTDAALNIGFLDVTEPPYNADNTGASDATAAFQQALDDGYAYNFSVWVPKGIYSISSLNMYQVFGYAPVFGAPFGGQNRKFAMQMIGDIFGGNPPILRSNSNLGAGTFIDLTLEPQPARNGAAYVPRGAPVQHTAPWVRD